MPGTPSIVRSPPREPPPRQRAGKTRGEIHRLAERMIVSEAMRQFRDLLIHYTPQDQESWRIFREVWDRQLRSERTSALLLANILQLPRTTVRDKLSDLVESGKLVRNGTGAETAYVVPDAILRSTSLPGGPLDQIIALIHKASADLREIEQQT